MDASKEQIRCTLSSYYDLQKLRISIGNRLVASFYAKLGITSEDDEDSEGRKEFLLKLKKEYSIILDYVAKENVSVKKSIKIFTTGKKPLDTIKSEADYLLIRSYMQMLNAEDDLVKIVNTEVKSHPMWGKFFEGIKGCGPLMTGTCLAYLDPYKAKYVSSFFRYAGLDTVRDADELGNPIFVTKDGSYEKVVEKYHYETLEGLVHDVSLKDQSSIEETADFSEEFSSPIFKLGKLSLVKSYEFDKNNEPIYAYVNGELAGETYVGDVHISEHGRRKGDTVMQEYVDANGETKLKRGLSYNPELKTKLMGVLTGCLLKAKDPVYSAIYYDYKSRLENDHRHDSKTPAQRNMMAQRYMIKQFLRNMWTTWRDIEGLEVVDPYEVAKLGNKPHKYNEYQCLVAKRQRENRG